MGNAAYYDDNYRALLPADKDAAILDLGCGQGDFSRYLSGLGYRNVTAVDRDPQAIAALNDASGVTARTAEVSAATVELTERGWNLLVVKQMVYYFDRREAPALISALRDALAPDGRLIVEIFNGAMLSSRFTELKDPGIVTAYTDLGLRRLLEQSGLIVESVTGAKLRRNGVRGAAYGLAQSLWFKLYRLMLILERGRDDELPRTMAKTVIAVARKR